MCSSYLPARRVSSSARSSIRRLFSIFTRGTGGKPEWVRVFCSIWAAARQPPSRKQLPGAVQKSPAGSAASSAYLVPCWPWAPPGELPKAPPPPPNGLGFWVFPPKELPPKPPVAGELAPNAPGVPKPPACAVAPPAKMEFRERGEGVKSGQPKAFWKRWVTGQTYQNRPSRMLGRMTQNRTQAFAGQRIRSLRPRRRRRPAGIHPRRHHPQPHQKHWAPRHRRNSALHRRRMGWPAVAAAARTATGCRRTRSSSLFPSRAGPGLVLCPLCSEEGGFASEALDIPRENFPRPAWAEVWEWFKDTSRVVQWC